MHSTTILSVSRGRRAARTAMVALTVCIAMLPNAIALGSGTDGDAGDEPVAASAAVSGLYQDDPEPVYDRLMALMKRDYLNIGLLMRTQGLLQFDPPASGRNGFSIGPTRLRMTGELDYGFGYMAQVDFIRSPALTDARLQYALSDITMLQAGLFKPPFSFERLESVGRLDFVNRSQAAGILAPPRQIGVAVAGTVAEGALAVRGGIFNGNGPTLAGNDNNQLMYVARVSLQPEFGDANDMLHVGVNVSYNDAGTPPVRETIFGGDVRIQLGEILISSEVIQRNAAWDEDQSLADVGFHFTGGYHVAPQHQLLLRYDSFMPENQADSNLIIVGYNFWWTSPMKLQLNYAIPTHESGAGNHRVMANFQLLL